MPLSLSDDEYNAVQAAAAPIHPLQRDAFLKALATALEAHPVIAPRRDGRERALDLPATVFSQDAVLAGGDLNRAPTTPFGLPPG